MCLSCQLTSHNVMTLVFAPSAVIWAIFWLWRSGKLAAIKSVILSGLLGLGLSAFFFIPEVLEQKFVHVDSMVSGYFNFMAHYVSISQLFFSRFWGYGASVWGPDDGMSFSVGQLQWIVALIVVVFAIFRFKKNKSVSLMVLMSVVFGAFYAFLTHGRSIFIWDRLPMLQYAQFPWRLVALIVFYFSFTAGYLATIKFPALFKKILFVALYLGVIIWNVQFFRVDRPTRVTIEEKMAGRQWENQVTSGIFDYLPRSAPVPPGAAASTLPTYIEGQGGILNYTSGTNWIQFEANVSSPSAKIMIPLFTFPGLVTKVDGQKVVTIPDTDLGRVLVDVPGGTHSVSAKIGYTPVRLFSDIITLASIFILIRLILYARRHP